MSTVWLVRGRCFKAETLCTNSYILEIRGQQSLNRNRDQKLLGWPLALAAGRKGRHHQNLGESESEGELAAFWAFVKTSPPQEASPRPH